MKSFIEKYKKEKEKIVTSIDFEKNKYEKKMVFFNFLIIVPLFLILASLVTKFLGVSEYITSVTAFICAIYLIYALASSQTKRKFKETQKKFNKQVQT